MAAARRVLTLSARYMVTLAGWSLSELSSLSASLDVPFLRLIQNGVLAVGASSCKACDMDPSGCGGLLGQVFLRPCGGCIGHRDAASGGGGGFVLCGLPVPVSGG